MTPSIRVAQTLSAGSFAGAEAVACSLAKALVGRVDRSLLYLVLETRAGADRCQQLVERARAFGVEMRIFETDRRWSQQLHRQLRDVIRTDGVNVLHAHSYKTAWHGAFYRRDRSLGVRVQCFTQHGFDQTSTLRDWYMKATNVVGAYGSDAIIMVSRPIRDFFVRFPFLAKRSHLIPNAVVRLDPPTAAPSDRAQLRQQYAERYGLDPNAVWLAIVGRLTPIKNHELGVQLAGKLAERKQPVQILIVGSGPQQEAIDRLIHEHQLERTVIMTGNVSNVSEVYATIDGLLLTSLSEACPMVVLEAMEAALPVVASSVGGVPDLVVEETTGLTFPSRDVDAALRQTERLIQDVEFCRRLGQAGQLRAQTNFSPASWADQHIQLYQHPK